MQKQSLAGNWLFRQVGEANWLPAQVPGGVHTDLLAAGLIPDPFVADNEKKVQWVAQKDWEYAYIFEPDSSIVAEDKVFLVCDGLDTLAEVYLNDHYLGKTENQFRAYRWEVKKFLAPQKNTLRIVFLSVVNYITAEEARSPLHTVSQAIPGASHVRKAPCQFGWDWGPQLPTVGIWKDLRLEGYSRARLNDVYPRQQTTASLATLTTCASIEMWDDQPYELEVLLSAPDGTTWKETVPFCSSSASVIQQVNNPQLWWPNGYGAQPLYTLQVNLLLENTVLDSKSFSLGLRNVELRQEKDQWGRSFTFFVNDLPIFIKGSDWIPADSFPTRLSDQWLENLLRSAVASHQNMLRVWGGGFYEEDRFYNLCDRLGILLWQDTVFSCSIYPFNDEAYLDNVKIEIEENVRRLRHHASLALWCGNNEMEQGWVEWGWNIPVAQELKVGYYRFFHHLLPAWITAEDPDHSYWPSSPFSSIPFTDPQSASEGDMHYWAVWHGRKPFTAYRDQYPRFMSEFGFQALPTFETIQTYAQPADWNMTSYIMEHHQKNNAGNGLMIGQMTEHFRMPKDFRSLVYLSNILQAEGIRYGVEHWRRHRDRVSGTLYWQLNDCWPVASWSSLDYYGRWKALHYAACDFYAPVLLSLFDENRKVTPHVTNDRTSEFKGLIQWSLQDLNGNILQQGEMPVVVPPLSSAAFETITANLQAGQERQVIFTAALSEGAKNISSSLVTFVPNKHLALTDPELTIDVQQTSSSFTFTLHAENLARFIELSLPGSDVVFSDNYFDLTAGSDYRVTCPIPANWSIDRVRQTLEVRSLYDSFAG